MSTLILPPSCNWFQHNGVDTRLADRLLVTACFKNIVVYRIPEEKGIPQTLKLIPHTPGKVIGVKIFPDNLSHEFGHTVAVNGDQNTLSLMDIRNGSVLAQHTLDRVNLHSLCWGSVREEDVVVGVGDKGLMLIWQPKYLVAKSFTLESRKNLTVVEVLPQVKHQCLVASERTILLVSMLNGDIIKQYKGHDMPIYCIRFYNGEKNPRNVSSIQVNTRWKKDDDCSEDLDRLSLDQASKQDKEVEPPAGPFFASSDFGKKILVWDLSAKKFLANAFVPVSCSNKRMGKDRNQVKNSHIAINWAQDRLYSSTITGEVLEWDISLKEPKYRFVCHPHSRAVYNMEVMGSVIMTFSQDRTLQAYDLEKNSLYYSMPTMGACAHSLAFSPHDGNRLAVGMQDDSIRLLTFRENAPIKANSLQHNIRGRVLTLAWHPVQETKLLFGTSDGQVGIADIITNKTSTFAYFHQKSTYKVEWGPPVSPETTGMKEEWYAYSFGDRELVGRGSSNLEDPIWLDKILGIEKGTNSGFCLSEFSFSPDRCLLAIGSLSGEIKIFERMTLQCLIVISRARKVIQHLLWKPLMSSVEDPYILGVASGENSVYIFNLKKHVTEKVDEPVPTIITHPNRELSAHAGRVIWLSWSLHQDGLLVSASYDHTVQIWDTNTGEPLCNYGGHTHRVFRCEFSPIDSDKVISFAEENCIHEWYPSEQTTRTPAESAAVLKEYRKKPKADKVESVIAQDEEKEKEENETSQPPGGAKLSAESSAAVIKKLAKRSSFPLLHNVLGRKKSFRHICILSLAEMKKAQKESQPETVLSEDIEEEALEEPENPILNGKAEEEEELKVHINNVLEKYHSFTSPDQDATEPDDVAFCLNFFGSLPQVDKVVQKEIKNHEENENFSRANLMHCWRGSLESQIKWAAKHKRLDPFLVSAAPQISFSLWEHACAAYAEQLMEELDFVTAATYLLFIHKDEEAIDMLLRQKLYREALTIAKYKLGFNTEIIQKVMSTWACTAVGDGEFELASILKFYMGNIEDAARALAKRIKEPQTLIVATQLFLLAGNQILATSTATDAFKETVNKNEFHKFELILPQMPHLEWCRCINICNRSIWDHMELFKKTFVSGVDLSGERATEPDKDLIFGPTLISTVKQRWSVAGITPSEYLKLSQDISVGLPPQPHPISGPDLWFSVSISLSQLLLDGCSSEANNTWEHHIESILKNFEVNYLNKIDQKFYLTHLLLPNGVSDLSPLEIPLPAETNISSINRLQYLYIVSETQLILSLLESDKEYLPWRDHSSANGNKSLNDANVSIALEAEQEKTTTTSTDCESEPKMKKSPEKMNFCLFNSKEDFFSALESYVDICIANGLTEEATEESIKCITEIIALLLEKSAVTLQFVENILSKLSNFEK